MALTSAQIASMSGGYQAMYSQQQHHAAMLSGGSHVYGGGYGGSPMSLGESAFGGGMNALAGMAPIGRAGLSVAGMDPMGVGMMAGMGLGGAAYASGTSLAGAAALGAGAGAIAAIPVAGMYAAANYAGGQMMQGMQQQQQFNMLMRTTYGHRPNAYGGGGFTSGALGGMGEMMRGMAMEQGPRGQMVGFEELGRLAASMGRMGMDQGVRDAREFRDRFKQMVTTLKTIAEEMGTSLEEAQKMMQGMRSAGVFGMKNQARVSQAIRQGAYAGGLATSEVTGMMGVGSQISRMIGGRGQAGAMGGMRAITDIGIAQQMGILSEEDIYSVTGLTGAEGRRALATQQMQTAARFLKSGLGRRIVAAMAGEGGRLDEASVQEFMAGGVGTGATMGMAYRNLGRVGRAGFVRNEGRLRGEILGRFGGMIPAIAMGGWLGQRGIDPNSDRAMMFAQRRLGMNADEADQLMKMVRNLPRMMEERRYSAEEMEFSQARAGIHARSGMQGLKNKLRQAEATVSGALQQYGADLMTSVSDRIDRIINRTTGALVTRTDKDVMRMYDRAMQGDRETFAQFFGAGGMIGKQGAYDQAASQFADAYRGGGMRLPGFLGDIGRRLQAPGVDRRGAADMLRGLTRGGMGWGLGADISAAGLSLGQVAGTDILRAQAYGALGGRTAEERLSRFGTFLGRQVEERGEYGLLGMAYQQGDTETRQRIMGRVLGGAGRLGGEASALRGLAAGTNLFEVGGGLFGTVQERHEAMGRTLLQGTGRTAMDLFGAPIDREHELRMLASGGGARMGPNSWAARFGRGLGRMLGMRDDGVSGFEADPSKGLAKIGAMFDERWGRNLGMQVMSRDVGVRSGAMRRNLEAMANIRRRLDVGTVTGEEKMDLTAQLQFRMSADMASKVGTLWEDTGGGEAFERGLDSLADQYNADQAPGAPKVTKEQLRASAANFGGLQQHKTKERIRQAAIQSRARAEKSQDAAGRLYGLVGMEGGKFKISGFSKEELSTLGKSGQDYLKWMALAQQERMGMQGVEGAEGQDLYRMQEEAKIRAKARASFRGTGQAGRELLIRRMREQGAYGEAASLEQRMRIEKEIAGGGAGAVAKLLGGELDVAGQRDIAALVKGQRGAGVTGVQGLLKSMGLRMGDVGDEGLQQLMTTLAQAQKVSAMKPGAEKEAAAGDLMSQLQKSQEVIDKSQGERKEKENRANNPLLASIADKMGEVATASLNTATTMGSLPAAIGDAVAKAVAEKEPE